MQKGYGVGGLFKGLARSFAPVLKCNLIAAGKKALKTGVEVLSDVSQGKNVKESVKRRVLENVNDIFTSIKDSSQKKKITRKRTGTRKGSSSKRRRKPDIFG
jgi:precorrin isomerase